MFDNGVSKKDEMFWQAVSDSPVNFEVQPELAGISFEFGDETMIRRSPQIVASQIRAQNFMVLFFWSHFRQSLGDDSVGIRVFRFNKPFAHNNPSYFLREY